MQKSIKFNQELGISPEYSRFVIAIKNTRKELDLNNFLKKQKQIINILGHRDF